MELKLLEKIGLTHNESIVYLTLLQIGTSKTGAILKRSRKIALQCLTIDPNVGNAEMAESIFNEMIELQKDYLRKFK